MMLGTLLSMPACLLAAYAPTDDVLVVARIFGGFAAGMAYPTTLALITALWSGPGRTKSIALWSALGGAIASLGPLVAGWLLEHFWWGSVFLVTLPLAVIALVMAWMFVPAHVNESTEPVDNLGGILSVLLVAGLVLSINFAPVPGKGTLVLGLAVVALAAGGGLRVAAAACREPALRPRDRRQADLLGRGLRRDHRLRLAHGRDVRQPAVPPERARLQHRRGRRRLPARDLPDGRSSPRARPCWSRRTAPGRPCCSATCSCSSPSCGCCCSGRRTAATGRSAWPTPSSGSASGLAGTPASHSLTGSVPVRRAGMASGTADLQRDLGGAIMQSIFGALLTAGYASAFASAIGSSSDASKVSPEVRVRAHEVVRGSRAGRPAVPEVRRPDHRRGEVVLPAGRRLGLRRVRSPVMEIQGLGWRTDLALLEISGSVLEDRGDHLVVRTPDNPTFWWGNFLMLAGSPDRRGRRAAVARGVRGGVPGRAAPDVRHRRHGRHGGRRVRRSPPWAWRPRCPA